MLPPLTGCVHLSVEAGCGGTTWGLQYAREVLGNDKHVVWICEEMPDGERFSQLFSQLHPTAVSKFHLSAIGENTDIGITSAIDLLDALKNIELVVIDDWTPKSGKSKSNVTKAMINLIQKCTVNDVRMIAISAAYEDASGSGWKSRGNLDGCEIWFLHRNNLESMMRELHTPADKLNYTLSDEGFTPHM
jgi:hypothetical protein